MQNQEQHMANQFRNREKCEVCKQNKTKINTQGVYVQNHVAMVMMEYADPALSLSCFWRFFFM